MAVAAPEGRVSLVKAVSEETLVTFQNLTSPGSISTVPLNLNGRSWMAVASCRAGSVSLVMKCLNISPDETSVVYVKPIDIRAKPMVAHPPLIIVSYNGKASEADLPSVEGLAELGCGTNGSFTFAMGASVTVPPRAPHLGEDLVRLLESHDVSDVSFCLGDKEFPAHKAIILARCPALAEIAAASPCSSVQIHGNVNPEAFSAFLRYLYTNQLPYDPSERQDKEAALMFTQNLFMVAKKFKNSNAQRLCERRMLSSLSVENAASIITFAQKQCLSFLQLSCCTVVVSKGWLPEVLKDKDFGVKEGVQPTNAKDALLLEVSRELKRQRTEPPNTQ